MVSVAFALRKCSICTSPQICWNNYIFCFLQENSLLRAIGHIELDLPEPPEKAPRPPPQSVDPYSRYGPKAEITHIFRAPEKLPPKELSLTFLGLTILPLLGFLIGVSLACAAAFYIFILP